MEREVRSAGSIYVCRYPISGRFGVTTTPTTPTTPTMIAIFEQHQNGIPFTRSSHDLAMSLSVTLTHTGLPPPVLTDLPVNRMATKKVWCG